MTDLFTQTPLPALASPPLSISFEPVLTLRSVYDFNFDTIPNPEMMSMMLGEDPSTLTRMKGFLRKHMALHERLSPVSFEPVV